MLDRKRPVFLALSRDQGSLQAILPVVRALREEGADVSLVAPAATGSFLTREGAAFEALDEDAFAADPARCLTVLFERHKPDLLLSGCSPAHGGAAPRTPEQFAILEARRRGCPSLSVLDYWGAYEPRFSLKGGALLLPDRLCVLDKKSRQDLEALGVLPALIAVTHNPWLDRLALAPTPPCAIARAQGGWTLLFVSQPLRAFPEEDRPQERMLRGLIEALPPLPEGARHKILVWRHPSEPAERWRETERFATPAVEVVLEEKRGGGVLAYVDFLATFHSSVIHEALYDATPCLSLRFGVQKGRIEALYSEELGLSQAFATPEALRDFFAQASPQALRERLRACQKQRLSEGLFFSDGGATRRVVAEVRELLEKKR